MLRILHAFVSGKADGGDATLVRPSNWNAAHMAATTVIEDADAYSIVDADNGKVIRATGSASQTFTLPAASGLIADWAVLIENKNTGNGAAGELIIDPNGSDTVDGLSGGSPIYTWPGSLHLLRRTGSTSWQSIMLRGGMIQHADSASTPAAATLHWPPNVSWVDIELWGAGGGGASGQRGAGSTAISGSAGGGGGAKRQLRCRGDLVAASTALTLTPGTGGAQQSGRTTDGNGVAGNAGGTTTLTGLGATIHAYGGNGGAGATGSGIFDGGNGGSWWATNLGSGSSRYPGSAGGVPSINNGSTYSIFGGGGGGGCNQGGSGASAGSKSALGGCGGGGAGGRSSGNVGSSGAAGGSPLTNNGEATGDGGAAGTAGNAGTAGTVGPTMWGPGTGGGGGGGGGTGQAGGDGGAGGFACGGGGGGTAITGNNSGAGGGGGNGFGRLTYG